MISAIVETIWRQQRIRQVLLSTIFDPCLSRFDGSRRLISVACFEIDSCAPARPFETRSLPSSLAATHRGFAFYVAFPKSSIETRLLPSSLAATHRGFAFYVAFPKRSIETRSFPNSLAASLAVLPSISLCPNAPLKLVRFPARSSLPLRLFLLRR